MVIRGHGRIMSLPILSCLIECVFQVRVSSGKESSLNQVVEGLTVHMEVLDVATVES